MNNCPKVSITWLPDEQNLLGPHIYANISLATADVFIGELTEQTLNISSASEVIEIKTWPINSTNPQPLPAIRIGPLLRNITYSPEITIQTQLSYTEKDGSIGVLENILETCQGRDFMATEWPCLTGDETIPKGHVCNNPLAPDCGDGSDEATSLCTGGINYFVVIIIVAYFFLGAASISLGK